MCLFQPANIILTKDYKFKLIDFGCARRLTKEDGEVGGIVGNPEFTGEPSITLEVLCDFDEFSYASRPPMSIFVCMSVDV